ncbi:hypothetical protein O3P69_001997 [Scylla paramamosain]|uniref:Uncharacterized protein n=1 Tax=Scylla paramamosain TaxID=85552 RepID=A0AAW0V4D7_SCYPA
MAQQYGSSHSAKLGDSGGGGIAAKELGGGGIVTTSYWCAQTRGQILNPSQGKGSSGAGQATQVATVVMVWLRGGAGRATWTGCVWTERARHKITLTQLKHSRVSHRTVPRDILASRPPHKFVRQALVSQRRGVKRGRGVAEMPGGGREAGRVKSDWVGKARQDRGVKGQRSRGASRTLSRLKPETASVRLPLPPPAGHAPQSHLAPGRNSRHYQGPQLLFCTYTLECGRRGRGRCDTVTLAAVPGPR